MEALGLTPSFYRSQNDNEKSNSLNKVHVVKNKNNSYHIFTEYIKRQKYIKLFQIRTSFQQG